MYEKVKNGNPLNYKFFFNKIVTGPNKSRNPSCSKLWCSHADYLQHYESRLLQHLSTFRGPKKVVISSFPDFKDKVLIAAI
jgi:hypothetical protein